jgi:hypothetical protein
VENGSGRGSPTYDVPVIGNGRGRDRESLSLPLVPHLLCSGQQISYGVALVAPYPLPATGTTMGGGGRLMTCSTSEAMWANW